MEKGNNDLNKDGKYCFDEFKTAMESNQDMDMDFYFVKSRYTLQSSDGARRANDITGQQTRQNFKAVMSLNWLMKLYVEGQNFVVPAY